MEFVEMGNSNKKTFLMLPGTSCTWQINFFNVIDSLKEKYHLICVNYDGFDGGDSVFSDMITITKKIEKYILERYDGRIDAVYGSSLGGSFVGLLAQREVIHFEHAFIGSSDFDQSGKFAAKVKTAIIGNLIAGVAKPRTRKIFKKMTKIFFGMRHTYSRQFLNCARARLFL